MQRLVQLLKICVCIGGLAVYLLALFVPIYTDEIVTRMVHSRYYLDGHTLKYLFPQCDSTFFSQSPLLLIPSLTLDAWKHTGISDLANIRTYGFISAILWMILIATSIRSLEKKSSKECSILTITAVVIAFCSLGITPFIMVLNRPEQFMVMSISLLSLIPFLVRPTQKKAYELLLGSLLVGGALIFFPSHPKALIFLPLWIVVVLYLVQSKIMRGIVLFSVLIISAQVYSFYSHRAACPEDPILEAKLQSEMVSPSSIVRDPVGQLSTVLNNIIYADNYVRQAFFLPAYPLEWLPRGNNFFKIDILCLLLNLFFIVFVNFLLLFCSISTFNSVLVDIRLGRYRPGTAIQFSLWIGIFSLLAFESSKFFYETRLFLPLLGLSTIIAWYDYYHTKLNFQNLRIALLILLSAALLSQVSLLKIFKNAPEIWSSNSMLEQQMVLTVPSQSYSDIRESIQKTAQKCNMLPATKMSKLIIDDWTYPIMSQSFQPFHVVFLRYEYWRSVNDLKAFMESKNSDGFILRCNWLSDKQQYNNLIEENGICCWNSRS